MIAIVISTISYIAVIWLLGSCLIKDATGSFAVAAAQMGVDNITDAAAALANTTSPPPPQYTFDNVQNCSLAVDGVCKYGLMNDYQVSVLQIRSAMIISRNLYHIPQISNL